MRKRGLCCRPVSVRPSATLLDCIHMAEDIVNLLVRPGSHIILVFFDLSAPYSIPRGTPSAGALNTRGWKNWRFSTEITVYLGNGKDKLMVAMER